jgi:hypothetical protein
MVGTSELELPTTQSAETGSLQSCSQMVGTSELELPTTQSAQSAETGSFQSYSQRMRTCESLELPTAQKCASMKLLWLVALARCPTCHPAGSKCSSRASAL